MMGAKVVVETSSDRGGVFSASNGWILTNRCLGVCFGGVQGFAMLRRSIYCEFVSNDANRCLNYVSFTDYMNLRFWKVLLWESIPGHSPTAYPVQEVSAADSRPFFFLRTTVVFVDVLAFF